MANFIIETRYYQPSTDLRYISKVNFFRVDGSKALHVQIENHRGVVCEKLHSPYVRQHYPEVVADVKADPIL